MAAKKQTPAAVPKNRLIVLAEIGENPDKATACVLAQPEVRAALTIQTWQGANIDVNEIAAELKEQTTELKKGDMSRAEAMLLSQANTLDELFHNLARKAGKQEYLKQFESYLKLAFKAQAQSRATLEALSNIKNPPVVYAKQANFSNGPQQVNNGVQGTRAKENYNQQNELLEQTYGERLDSREKGQAISSNQTVAALG